MKRILTADLHIHSHFNNPIFINIGVDYLEHLGNYCFKNNIEEVDVLGDIFHISSKINVEIFIPVFEAFEKLYKRGIKINIIPGNHEILGNGYKTILIT
jgi:DNA repair exonuclease SbcCD nuclease subunit